MDGAGHEERVAQTKDGQWLSWNMDGKKNEKRVNETAIGQWSN